MAGVFFPQTRGVEPYGIEIVYIERVCFGSGQAGEFAPKNREPVGSNWKYLEPARKNQRRFGRRCREPQFHGS